MKVQSRGVGSHEHGAPELRGRTGRRGIRRGGPARVFFIWFQPLPLLTILVCNSNCPPIRVRYAATLRQLVARLNEQANEIDDVLLTSPHRWSATPRRP
jgi:hypothetical protein